MPSEEQVLLGGTDRMRPVKVESICAQITQTIVCPPPAPYSHHSWIETRTIFSMNRFTFKAVCPILLDWSEPGNRE